MQIRVTQGSAMIESITFGLPEAALLLLALPLLLWWELQPQRWPSLTVPALAQLHRLKNQGRTRHRLWPFFFRLLGLIGLIIALARPQLLNQRREFSRLGIDIMLTLDLSKSMESEDMRPNRLVAAKAVINQFIRKIRNDRLGLVVFSGEAYTQCPLTYNVAIMSQMLSQINADSIKEEGTAIGLAIAEAVKRLRDSAARSKVIILLTDGENNMGHIAPVTAAEMARHFAIRIYTIGIGQKRGARIPIGIDPATGEKRYYDHISKLDEATLRRIAEITAGSYFYGRDKAALGQIFEEIDRLEKSRLKDETHQDVTELFPIFSLFGLLALGLEFILRQTWFLRHP
jgi:Ca-activated chloride channel family protein